jgi:hypothetical protein
MTKNWEARQLALVPARIANAGWWIVRHQQLIEELEASGRSTDDAEKTLALIVTVLASMRETEATIGRLLSRNTVH